MCLQFPLCIFSESTDIVGCWLGWAEFETEKCLDEYKRHGHWAGRLIQTLWTGPESFVSFSCMLVAKNGKT